MLLISHRGDHSDAPENTLEAFAKALQRKVDGLETDVRVSADGHPILFHDRITSDGRATSSLTRDQLAEVAGHEIATLDQALNAYPSVFWNLEIKSAAALPLTLTTLEREQPTGRILITSFLHQVVFDCSQRSNHECGLLVAHRPVNIRALLPPTTDAKIKSLVIDFQVVDNELVEEAVAAKIKLYVYGMITLEDHRAVAQLAVAGIITDHLKVAHSALRQIDV